MQVPPLPPGFQLETSQLPINSGVDPSDEIARRNADRGDAQFDYQMRRHQEEDARREEEQRALKLAVTEKEQEVLIDTLRRIDLIDEVYGDANDSSVSRGLGEIGFWGSALSNFAGTDANDLYQKLQPLKAVEAIDKLLEVKSDPRNPTGGAFGQLSESELSLLQSYTASLEQSQSIEEFNRNLGRIKRAALDIVQKMDPAKAEEIINRGQPTFNADGSITYDKRGQALFGLDAPPSDGTPPKEPPKSGAGMSGNSYLAGLAQGTGDAVEGISGAVGAFTDPFAGVIADALGYDSSKMRPLGQVNREALGLPQSPEGIGRSAREFAAGALTFGGAARALGAAASAGTTQNVLREVGRTPIRDTVAGAGAGAGAAIGEEVGGVPGQVAGLVAGGLTGYAGANALANAARGTPNALSQAATRQKVDLMPADTGGPVARAVTTGTRASPLSVGPVAAQAERSQGQLRDAARRTAQNQGEVLDTQQAGEAVREGAEAFIAGSRKRGERLYSRATQQAQGVTKIKPLQTVEAAQEALARLRENPAATDSDIASLTNFIARIEGGATIQGLRDARTALSQNIYDGKLRAGSDQAMWKGVLSNVADDIDRGLRQAGREDAANTFRVADKLWSERIDTIDKVLQPILGRDGQKGGEQVLQAVESMARGQSGGNVRLSRLLGALGEEQAGNLRATIVDRLGRARPGNQDAQGEAFSAATFLTNWNNMTPQARTSIFPVAETRGALDDIAEIAAGTKRGQSMANTSNTGVAVNSLNVIGGAAGAVTNLPLTLLGAGSVHLTGRLMANPTFAKLLARTSRMPPEAANRTFSQQLGIIATREPMLADDVGRLTAAMNDNGRLAAEEEQPQG